MSNQAPPPPSPQYQPVQPLSPQDEKMWSMLIHLAGILFGFIPALVGYLVLKDRGPFVREHTKAALNFQISYTIYVAGFTLVAMFIILATFGVGAVILLPLLFAVAIVMIIFMIMAAVKANGGQYYEYPLTIKFIK